MKNNLLVIALGLTFASWAFAAASAETELANKEAAAKVAINLCSSCHGPRGDSVSPTFPKLAGQQKDYLAAQLRALKAKNRADPEAHDYMWGMAATVPDSLIDSLAEYYASQKPAAGKPGDLKLIAQGQKLFENGDSKRQIAPCAGCHGTGAEGQTIFPRLAGQHAAYTVRQLQVIQTELRKSPIMHGIITELTADDIKAVAEFLQSK
jgi:cytochrome c553